MRRKNALSVPNNRGFSLMEALVSLIVVSIVLAGATALFLQNQKVSTAQVSLATMRTSLRAAMATIGHDLRSVGAFMRSSGVTAYSGNTEFGLRLLECNNINPSDPSNHIGGYTGYSANLPDRIRVIEPDLAKNTTLYDSYQRNTNDFKSVKIRPDDFLIGDILIITNANVTDDPTLWTSDLFEVTNNQSVGGSNPFSILHFANNAPSGLNGPLGFGDHAYPPGSAVFRVRVWEYYVDLSDPTIPKLYRREFNRALELVAEYIEDLQVALGLDTNGDDNISDTEWVNTSFTAITDAQLHTLRAVRVTLVARTGYVPVEMAGKRAGTYDIYYRQPDVEDHQPDNETELPRYREVYEEVIYLRNLRPDRNS
ncbi:MAG: PilW family protein [Acidobacteria bacterium]|nr:PilW family protein [Acidobacteriota bacterium]